MTPTVSPTTIVFVKEISLLLSYVQQIEWYGEHAGYTLSYAPKTRINKNRSETQMSQKDLWTTEPGSI